MRFVLSLWLMLQGLCLSAQEILPADQVFKPQLQWRGEQLVLGLDFPEGYYLYADKTLINGEKNLQSTPPPEPHRDEYLGETAIWKRPPQWILSPESASPIHLQSQGCREKLICYPPQRWTLDIPPRPEALPALPSVKPALFAQTPQPLPAERAFDLQLLPQDDGAALLSVVLPVGYYLYQNRIQLRTESASLTPNLPAGEWHEDEYFGRMQIYREQLEFILPATALKGQRSLTWTVQGCAEHLLCYPPFSRSWDLKTGEILPENPPVEALPAPTSPVESAPASTERDWGQLLQDEPWWALLLVFGTGIAVSLTACVYPLLPIVSGIVIGDAVSSRRALGLISVYILAMGLALALLGAIFALFNINVQLLAQRPLFSTLAALLLFALSLSLFDVYSLRLPSRLQNRVEALNQKQASGSYWGAAVMGALSILVISPCATPVLSALLLFSPQHPLQSALTLFIFGLGTGVPLFIFTTVLKRFMPRAGQWMNLIKRFFALLILALAVWLLGRSQSAWALPLWLLYSLFVAVYLLPAQWQSKKERAALFLALLAFLTALNLSLRLLPGSASTASAAVKSSIFQKVNNLEDIRAQVAASPRPVILDFYADWCLSCHVWEREIWNHPDFAAQWPHFTLLKVDMTAFNEEHRALLQAFHLVGPPAVLLLRPGEGLTVQETIIGETSAAAFRQKLAQWQQI